MVGIGGGRAEGAFKPIKKWADFVDMFGVDISSAKQAVVVVNTHLLFVSSSCNFKNLAAPKIREILTSFEAYVFGLTKGTGPFFKLICEPGFDIFVL